MICSLQVTHTVIITRLLTTATGKSAAQNAQTQQITFFNLRSERVLMIIKANSR